MKKIIILLFSLYATFGIQAQIKVSKSNNYDIQVSKIINNPSLRLGSEEKHYEVVIKSANAKEITEELKSENFKAFLINSNMLTASVNKDRLKTLTEDKRVQRVSIGRKSKTNTDITREVTGVSKVQAGEGLDTPFDGTGVLLGIIDRGYRYRHAAFLDENGNSRIRRIIALDRGLDSLVITDEIPDSTDVSICNEQGHATHVLGIAAGSRIEGFNY